MFTLDCCFHFYFILHFLLCLYFLSLIFGGNGLPYLYLMCQDTDKRKKSIVQATFTQTAFWNYCGKKLFSMNLHLHSFEMTAFWILCLLEDIKPCASTFKKEVHTKSCSHSHTVRWRLWPAGCSEFQLYVYALQWWIHSVYY